MPKVAQAVVGHNSRILREEGDAEPQPGCNCMGGLNTWPVQGKCLTTCVVYEACVKELPSGKTDTYTGVTERTFKRRLYEHRKNANSEKGRIEAALSAHIWALKDKNIRHEVTWKLKCRGPEYNPLAKKM